MLNSIRKPIYSTITIALLISMSGCSSKASHESASVPAAEKKAEGPKESDEAAIDCAGRATVMEDMYDNGQMLMEYATHSAFNGTPVRASIADGFKGDIKNFEQTYGEMTACEGETNDHFLLQMNNYVDEIEQML